MGQTLQIIKGAYYVKSRIKIGTILNVHHGWEGNDHRYELMKRVQLWSFVCDQPEYDIGERFMRRIEYQPIGITV